MLTFYKKCDIMIYKEGDFIKNKIITIPNILSVVRILMIPFFIKFYMQKMFVQSIITLLLSGLTDVVDGYIARKYNMISNLGKILDPFADKITQISIVICLIIHNPLILVFAIIFSIKELLMLIGSFILLRKGKRPTEAKWWGKVGTFVIYTFLTLVLLSNIFPTYITNDIVMYGIIITSIFTLFALYNYYLIFIKLLKSNSSQKNNT